MARLVYALSGQGRGHTSRGLAVAHGLRARGHEVTFCGGGTARSVLESVGEPVLPGPTLRQVMWRNRLMLLTTGVRNAPTLAVSKLLIRRLMAGLEALGPDLLITDFDPYAHHAAVRLGLPVVSLDHQQVVTETQAEPPKGDAFSAFVARRAIRSIVARRPARRLITTFFEPPLVPGSSAVLLPPILRPEILALEPTVGTNVLVYINGTVEADWIAKRLRDVDAQFVVYGVRSRPTAPLAHVTFRPPSVSGFLADLAACRAVVSTAGFTLLSEALHLGKPILAVPNRGIYEQALNAAYLERKGRGRAVFAGLRAADVRAFLADADVLAGPHGGPDGLAGALAEIEAVLGEGPRPPLR